MYSSNPFLLEYSSYGHGPIGSLCLHELYPPTRQEIIAREISMERQITRKKNLCKKNGHKFDESLYDGRKVCSCCRVLEKLVDIPQYDP